MNGEEVINGQVARKIRAELGLTQGEFWGALGIQRETGKNYEMRGRLIEPVRRLLFMHYVAGIPVNAPPDELVRMGKLIQSSDKTVEALTESLVQLGIAAANIRQLISLKQETENGK